MQVDTELERLEGYCLTIRDALLYRQGFDPRQLPASAFYPLAALHKARLESDAVLWASKLVAAISEAAGFDSTSMVPRLAQSIAELQRQTMPH